MYAVSRGLKPRVIRRVVQVAKDGRAKVARDRRTLITIERIKARTAKSCAYHMCPYYEASEADTHPRGGVGVIAPGTEYALFKSAYTVRRMGGRTFPEQRTYHFDCLPLDARPLVRFFFPRGLWKMRLVHGEAEEVERTFTSVEAWEVWLSKQHPVLMRKDVFHLDQPGSKQRGTNLYYAMLSRVSRNQ
jgi:hypothetical protein